MSNASNYDLTQAAPLVENVRTLQLRFLGHVLRLPDDDRAIQGVCTVYSTTWEEETRKATNRVSKLHSSPIRRHRQHDWPRQAVSFDTRPLWLEEDCSHLLCSWQMMIRQIKLILLLAFKGKPGNNQASWW